MKPKKILVGSVFLALFASSGASALDEYICHSDSIVGFQKQYGSWMPKVFNDRIVVTIKELHNTGSYSIKTDPDIFRGIHDHSWDQDKWVVSSESGYSRFTMYKGNLRFSLAQMRGYVNDDPNATPIMTVGRCRRL